MTASEQLNETLARIERYVLMGSKDVFTIEEAAAFTGYSVQRLYALTSTREIPHYKRGGKVYFRKDELTDWMTEVRIMSNAQIEMEATKYITRHPGTLL